MIYNADISLTLFMGRGYFDYILKQPHKKIFSMRFVTIIICALLLTACNQQQAQEQRVVASGQYQLAVDHNGNAWRLNTVTGEMSRCWQGTASTYPPACYTALSKE